MTKKDEAIKLAVILHKDEEVGSMEEAIEIAFAQMGIVADEEVAKAQAKAYVRSENDFLLAAFTRGR